MDSIIQCLFNAAFEVDEIRRTRENVNVCMHIA